MSSHPLYTIGVEEEYQIIDPGTGELSSEAPLLLKEAQRTLGEAVQYEMLLSQIETATQVCQTLTEVRTQLTYLRRELITAASKVNKHIAAAGTHPFSSWQGQPFTPGERYMALQQDYQQLAREQTIFGCHVHVGIDNREEALQVLNHARPWLAPLLALTCNSPFWLGKDTGYSSYRTEIWGRWPFSGPPQLFSSLKEYEDLITALMMTKVIESGREVYWDIRLSARFRTIEVRIADTCLTIDEAVMLAGLVRALLQTCHERVLQEEPYPQIRQEILRACHWYAARYGTSSQLIDIQQQKLVPARQFITAFLNFVRPALEKHGDWHEVSNLVETVLQGGTGAARQRAIYQQGGNMRDVVKFIVSETAKGTL